MGVTRWVVVYRRIVRRDVNGRLLERWLRTGWVRPGYGPCDGVGTREAF